MCGGREGYLRQFDILTLCCFGANLGVSIDLLMRIGERICQAFKSSRGELMLRRDEIVLAEGLEQSIEDLLIMQVELVFHRINAGETAIPNLQSRVLAR